jgi:signal transduction histidine kinase
VDRKARALADLVRRLRRFGGREVDAPSALPVDMLIDMAQRIVLPELRRAGARLEVGVVPPDLVVQAQEIELTQALVNLLRNAISAAPDALVRLEAGRAGEQARITLRNTFVRERQGAGQGMGVGLIIARTIVEAHGGTLMQEENGQEMVVTLMLPLAGGL